MTINSGEEAESILSQLKSEISNSNCSPTRAFGKDILNYIPAQIIPAVVSFFAIAAYTRLLNPEQYGQYILIITTASIVSSAVFSWLNQSGIRYYEEYKTKGILSQFTSTAFVSLFVTLAIVLFVWYGVAVVVNRRWHPNLISLIQLGGVVLATQTIYAFILVILRAARKSFKYGLYTVLNSLGTFLVALCLLKYKGLGPKGILISMIILSAGVLVVELTIFFSNHLIKISNYSTDLVKRFASYGIPMTGVSIGALILSVSDRYMIQYFMDTEAVGVYSASYNFAQGSIQGLSNMLSLAAFPVIFQTFARYGEKETNILLGRMISIYLIVLIPAILGVAILSKDIIWVVLGKSFGKAYIILPWVVAGVFCHGLGLYCVVSFELREKTLFMFYIWALAAVVNIVLNIFMIPRFGILGAAYTTFIAYFIYLLITWVFGVKLLPFSFPWQTLWKTALAAFIMAFVLKISFSSAAIGVVPLICKILLGGSIYFIVLGVLKESIFLDSLKFGRKVFSGNF